MKKVSKFPAKRKPEETDALLPFMSLLLIIIPMLLSNMAFHHFLAIEASVPGVSDAADEPMDEPEKKKEKMVMARLMVQPDYIEGEIVDEETAEVMEKLRKDPSVEGARSIFELYARFKDEFPKLDTVLVSIHQDVKYESVLQVMDQVKKPMERSLASANGVEKTRFNLVILPMALEGDVSSGGE